MAGPMGSGQEEGEGVIMYWEGGRLIMAENSLEPKARRFLFFKDRYTFITFCYGKFKNH